MAAIAYLMARDQKWAAAAALVLAMPFVHDAWPRRSR
jgi:hypothetical protein